MGTVLQCRRLGQLAMKQPTCLPPVGVLERTADFGDSWRRDASGARSVAATPPHPPPPQMNIRNPDTQYTVMLLFVLSLFGLDNPERSAFPLLLSSDYFAVAWGEFPIMPTGAGTEVAGSSQGHKQGLPHLWGSAFPWPEPTLATGGPSLLTKLSPGMKWSFSVLAA